MTATAAMSSHRDRPVSVVVVDGTPVVRKQYVHGRADEVFASMVDLWCSPFGGRRPVPGLPRPLRVGAAGCIEMSLVHGPTMATRTDRSRVADAIPAAAALLADLHAAGVTVPRRRTAGKVASACGRALPADDLGLVAAIRAAGARLDEVLVCSHGDFGPHNVVLSTDGPVLIDFDRVQMAGAGRDVQHAAAWLFATSVLDGTRSWDLGERFADAYLDHRPTAGPELAAGRSFHRAAALVRIATSWSDMAAAPAARVELLEHAARLVGAVS